MIADATNEISEPESIPFPLISDVMIANAATEEIDNLRRPVDNITKLNLWKQKNRKIKYWVGTISVRDETGLQFVVARSIVIQVRLRNNSRHY